VLATGQREEREIPSGSMTASKLVRDVKRVAEDWKYDRVSIGYPGSLPHACPLHEPYNLGGG
jgi:polyphosphate glucokinase